MFKKILTISLLTASALMVLPVLAATTGAIAVAPKVMPKVTAVQIACVGAAVNTREAAIDAAFTAYAQAVQSAYSVRATALQQAYTLTNGKDVKAAVQAAWTAFRTATKAASKTWRTSRNAAWTAFRTAAKACKSPSAITDTVNAVSDVTGQ